MILRWRLLIPNRASVCRRPKASFRLGPWRRSALMEHGRNCARMARPSCHSPAQRKSLPDCALIHRKISSWDALTLDQSALMLAVIGGRTDVVRILTAAGAELCLRGTGTRPSRRNQPSPSLEVTPRWLRSCAPVLHIDPNDKKPAFRNRIFMEGGASEADISAARAGVHCRTTPSLDTDPRARS